VNGVVAAYPIMVQQKSGHIVNISSIAGITPAVMLVPYSASKYGVVGLSHSLRMEAKGLGVKVSVACPNFINTPIWTTSKVLGSKAKTPKDFLKIFQWSPKLLDVDKAATIILKGVLKNKMTILNDFHSRMLWWNYRISPSFWMWMNDVYIMKKFRSMRK
jgi:short-subunit dehydrogenase